MGMKITLSKFAGFCDGVKRAFDMVMAIDMKNIKKPVFVLGSLVHNKDVIKKIEEKGIRKISLDKFYSADPGEIGTIIITAHGDGPDVFRIAQEKGIDVIDTTCPRVIKVQKLAKYFAEKDYQIILIGDKEHKEVEGIKQWGGKKTFVVSSKDDLEKMELGNEKIIIMSQTTQDEDFCRQIGEVIKKKRKDAQILETVCHTTHYRQNEIKEMAKENDVIFVLGSKASANSRRLWEIASSVNSRAYFIENAKEIKKGWLEGIENIAVTAGASTPSWIIEEVVESLEKLKG